MKTLIASLVGMVILFAYQALSWYALGIHKNELGYAKNQDSIMAYLSQHLHGDDVYFMPMPAPGTSMKEHEEFMKNQVGKPAAMIHYHASMQGEMSSQLVFGLIFNLLCVMLVSAVISSGGKIAASFGSRLALVMTFAIFLVIGGPLMVWNWWGYPMHYVMPDVLDMVLSWLLCGIWLAWYFGRGKKAAA